MGEFDLIKTYFAPLAGPEGLRLMDDAACLTPDPDYDLVLTKDTMVEGVHFPEGEYGDKVASRLMRVNLSDLAAKGAAPKGYLLSVAWPRSQAAHLERHAESFAQGLHRDQEAYGFHLYGGDTVGIDGPMVVSATFIGQLPTGSLVARSGAQVGDDVWVTGNFGQACLGLKVLNKDISINGIAPEIQAKWLGAYWRPDPCLCLADLLRSTATASADISDGLLSDLGHIAKASQIGFEVDLASIPFGDAALNWAGHQTNDAVMELLTFGDDYQLVFTAPQKQREKVIAGAKEANVQVTKIGICRSSKGVDLRGHDGELVNVDQGGFAHF